MTGLDGLLAAGRAAHEALMVDVVRLYRPGVPVFDRETGTDVPGPDTELYAGPGRVKPVQALSNDVQAGDREVVLRRYEVALPWSALPGDRVLPGDVVAVTASPDGRLVGLRLWVTGVEYSATATAWRLATEDRS